MEPLLLYSGGLDSAVLLHRLISEGTRPRLLFARIGSRQNTPEFRVVSRHSRRFRLPLSVVSAHVPAWDRHPLYDPSHVVGMVSGEESSAETARPSWIVPCRNAVLLSLALAEARSRKCPVVYAGFDAPHAGDTSPEYLRAWEELLRVSGEGGCSLQAPLYGMSKSDIIREAVRLGVDIAETYSCYTGHLRPCGVCWTCHFTHEAFVKAGIPDPRRYLTRRELLRHYYAKDVRAWSHVLDGTP